MKEYNFENRIDILAKVATFKEIDVEALRLYTDLVLSDVQDILRKSSIQSEEIIDEIYSRFGLSNNVEILNITIDSDVSEFITQQSEEFGITENDVLLRAIFNQLKKNEAD